MKKRTGLAHQWTRDDPRWPSVRGLTFCRVCGVVQRGDGRNSDCSGVTPPVALRAEPGRLLTELVRAWDSDDYDEWTTALRAARAFIAGAPS